MKGKKADPIWKGVCCKACWYAKGKKCVCRCGGEHHGKGNPSRETDERKTCKHAKVFNTPKGCLRPKHLRGKTLKEIHLIEREQGLKCKCAVKLGKGKHTVECDKLFSKLMMKLERCE